MASFKNLISNTSAQISSGGTITGDLVINGDLQVDGGGSLSFDEIIEGTSVIDVTDTEAFLVRKDSDGGDVFIVDTTNEQVKVGDNFIVNASGTTPVLTITGTRNDILFTESDTTDLNTLVRQQTGLFRIDTINDALDTITRRFTIDHSNGDATFTGNVTSDGNLTLRSDSGANIYFTEADGTNDEMMIGYDQANQRFRFRSNAHSLDRMLITKTGQVGINIVPATTLNVASPVSSSVTTFPTLRLTSQTETADWDAGDVNGAFEFYTADTSGNAPYVNAFIKSINEQENGTLPSGSLSFGTATYNAVSGATERMRLDSSGQLGIGTDSPNKLLEVSGSSAIRSTYTGTSSAGVGGALQLVQDDGSAIESGHRIGYVVFGASEDSSNTIHYGGSINAFATETYSASGNGTKLTFDVTANGATSRSTALTIDQDKNSTFAGSITASENTDTTFVFGRVALHSVSSDYATFSHYDKRSSGTSYALRQTSTGATAVNSASGQRVNFNINNLTKMVVSADGNVGIGTTNPMGDSDGIVGLEISNGASTGLTLKSTSSSQVYSLWADASGNLKIQDNTNNATPLTIDSSQNATFASNVIVGSTISTGSDLTLQIGDSGDTHLVLGEDSNNKGRMSWDASENSLEFHLIDSGTSRSNVLVLDSTGYVGIGNASPDTNLHILKASAGTVDAHSDAVLAVENSGTTAINILSGTTSHGQLQFGDSGQNDDGVLGYDQATNKMYILTNHSTTKKLVVDSAGNVGIGTDSPSQLLHVKNDGVGHADVNIESTDNTYVSFLQLSTNGNDWQIAAGGSSHSTFADSFYIYDTTNSKSTFRLDANSRISLSNNDTGTANTIFGYEALGSFTATGQSNTVIGHQTAKNAGANGWTGNVAMGYRALYTSAVQNLAYCVIIGSEAGYSINSTLPDGTVAIGSSSLYSLTSGTNNTVVGFETGKYNVTGGLNTWVGYQAGLGASGQSNSQNTGIGYRAGYSLTTGSNNTLLGRQTGLVMTSGADNTFVGMNAGSGTVSGDRHVSVGNQSMMGVVTADGATAVGYEALKSLTSGSGSLGVGYRAGDSITTGDYNTAIGYGALGLETVGDRNTAVGFNSLQSANGTNNASNTAVGFESGNAISLGQHNVTIGAKAGNIITTGDYNVMIGGESDPSGNNAQNQIVIGYNAVGGGDNSVVLGNSNVTAVLCASDGEAQLYASAIRFPATQVSNSNANALDDYEEGEHTVTVTCSTSGTLTVTSDRPLSYVKIGSMVTINGQLSVSSLSSPVGHLQISLPFTIGSGTGLSKRCSGSVTIYNTSGLNMNDFAVLGIEGENFFRVYASDGTALTEDSANAMTATSQIAVDLTYFV